MLTRFQRANYFGELLGGIQSSSAGLNTRGFFPNGSWGYSTSNNVQVTAFKQIILRNAVWNVLTHTGTDFFVKLNRELVATNIVEFVGVGETNSGDLGNTLIVAVGVKWCLEMDFTTKSTGTFTSAYNFWGQIS